MSVAQRATWIVLVTLVWLLVAFMITSGLGYVDFKTWNACRKDHTIAYCANALSRWLK